MFYCTLLMACLLSLPQGRSEPRTSTRRYKPVIQVTEEIDINDITFTTSAPEFDRSSSHKSVNYYNGVKAEGPNKGSPYNRIADTAPSVFPHVNYKDSYGSPIPPEKIYTTGKPLAVPAIKYKPYKVYKVQDGHDGFRSVPYKANALDKGKLLPFEPPTTYSGPEVSKQYSAKIVPFPTHYLPPKGPTRATNYLTQDNKNFIPSPTFSPAVLAQINGESSQKFADLPEIKPFTQQKEVNWPKPTKKPYHIKKSKKVYENHNSEPARVPEEFSANSEKLEENLTPSTLYKDSPQQSESFLSEISTLHKGGGSANNLDGVADSLDLKTGERVEFQMYGMDGPQSYKFGFDTGKGQNRHFRFEERDNTGKVKGHYGYLDEDGKMRIMKYEADPITGFHAGPVEISPDDN